MDLEVFDALTSAGVPAEKARVAVASIDKAIDRRYELHAMQLSTRGDLAELRASLKSDLSETEHRLVRANTGLKSDLSEAEHRLMRAITEMQRWTVGALFAGLATSTALIKLLH